MNIEKEIGNKIAHLPRAVRKTVVSMLEKGQNLDEILQKVERFVRVENSIHKEWYQTMLTDVKELRIDPECYAYQLTVDLNSGKVEPIKVVRQASIRLSQHKRLTNGHNGRMLEQLRRIVQQYITRSNDFFKYAALFIENDDLQGLTLRIKEHEESERQKDEDKLFQLQVIKHIRNLQDFDRSLPPNLMEIALSANFSDDPKIIGEQVLMVDRTHNYHQKQSFVIKQMCFDFTKHILTNVIANAILIEYLFKEDWVSRETHDLLIGAYDNIKKYGMNTLVLYRAQRLYEKNGLAGKKIENMNILDGYIVSLIKKYE